jgi:hypothetical protein
VSAVSLSPLRPKFLGRLVPINSALSAAVQLVASAGCHKLASAKTRAHSIATDVEVDPFGSGQNEFSEIFENAVIWRYSSDQFPPRRKGYRYVATLTHHFPLLYFPESSLRASSTTADLFNPRLPERSSINRIASSLSRKLVGEFIEKL